MGHQTTIVIGVIVVVIVISVMVILMVKEKENFCGVSQVVNTPRPGVIVSGNPVHHRVPEAIDPYETGIGQIDGNEFIPGPGPALMNKSSRTWEEHQAKISDKTGWSFYNDLKYMYPETETKGVYTFSNSLENRLRDPKESEIQILPWRVPNRNIKPVNPLAYNRNLDPNGRPKVQKGQENFGLVGIEETLPSVYCGASRFMPWEIPCQQGNNNAL